MNKEKYDNGTNYGSPLEKKALVILVFAIISVSLGAALFVEPPEPASIVSAMPIEDIADSGLDLTDTVNQDMSVLDYYIEEIETRYDTLFCMEDAFSWKESRGVSHAVSIRDSAFGILQITPIMLRHYHDIIGTKMFTIYDMLDPSCARMVFDVVQLHDNASLDMDSACDVWNPGCPISYRMSVKRKFNEYWKETHDTTEKD